MAEFVVTALSTPDDPLTAPGVSARDAAPGLFVGTLPAGAFEGRAVTVRVAMTTATAGAGCAPRLFRLPAVADGEADAARVALFSDSQSGAPIFQSLLQEASALEGDEGAQDWDLLVHLGDTTQDAQDEREAVSYFLAPLERFYSALQKKRRQRIPGRLQPRLGLASNEEDGLGVPPVLVVRANHDSVWGLAYNGQVTPAAPPLGSALPLPPSPLPAPSSYFVSETGPVRWIVLDAITPAVAEQTEWLRGICAARADAIAAAGRCRRTWTVVLVHIPPFIEFWDRVAWHNRSESAWGAHVRTVLLPILASEGACGVDALVGGHSHIYQRGALDAPGGAGRVPLLAIIGGAGGVLEEEDPGGRVASWGVYSVTAARHHFAELSVPAAPVVLPQWEGAEALAAAAACRQPLTWVAHELGGRILDRVILQPPPAA